MKKSRCFHQKIVSMTILLAKLLVSTKLNSVLKGYFLNYFTQQVCFNFNIFTLFGSLLSMKVYFKEGAAPLNPPLLRRPLAAPAAVRNY